MRADPLEDSEVLTEWLGEWLGDGRSLLLMIDYDGTLTPHVPNPAEACLIQRAQRSLSALARTPQVRLAIISGRDLGDVTARVGVPGAVYAGIPAAVDAFRAAKEVFDAIDKE